MIKNLSEICKNPALKHRHILTRAGNIRLRYVAVAATAIMLIFFGLYPADNQAAYPPVDAEMAAADPEAHDVQTESFFAEFSGDPEEAGRGLDPYYAYLGQKPVLQRPPRWTKTIKVQSGDTLGQLMERTTLSGDEYFAAMKAIGKHLAPSDIYPGQEMEVEFRNVENEGVWEEINYKINGLKHVSIRRDAHGNIIADMKEKPVEVMTHAARAVVSSSLFADLGRAGVPDGIINDLIKAYSWSVDFQRDIWGGERVELLYETKETKDGSYMRSGRLLYAKLMMRGKEMPIYLFEKDDGFPMFYEPNGQSVRKALLKTPVDGARISSGYGKRRHPVLGYTKMHKGLDFAAPSGTPIYAAGDGVIERANWFSSFGNYIKIRHNGTYKTAYAHLKGFAKGIRAGSRVKQGQVIGYVGTTGRSTGPHLHYEVHVNGKQVNPQSMKLPIGEKLEGKSLTAFKNTVASMDQKFATVIRNSTSYAAFEQSESNANAAN